MIPLAYYNPSINHKRGNVRFDLPIRQLSVTRAIDKSE